MTEILLAPGAWHSGRVWERLLPHLRDAGHNPIALGLPPTGPTGAGAGLHDHAEHLRRSIEACATTPVLVAHSYAGLVAQQALVSSNASLGRLVLLDAWIGDDGDSMLSLAPSGVAAHWRATRVSEPTGDTLPPPPPRSVGVEHPDDVTWLRPRLITQPWATFADPLRLPTSRLPGTAHAIVGNPVPGLPFEQWATRRAIPTTRIRSGHDAMVTAPGALADRLLTLLAELDR